MDIGVTEELEFWGKREEEWGSVEVELEIGEETLDLASVDDLLASLESLVKLSCFESPCGCLNIPYNTSAISISISSWAAEDDDFVVDFGGRSFGPLGFYNGRNPHQ